MDPAAAYRRYFPLIRQRARRLLGEGPQADDIAQETFLRLLRARVTGGDAGVVAWLYRTSANLAIDSIRRQRPRVGAEALEALPAPESMEATHALRSLVGALAQRLAVEVLQAGMLSRADGLTQPELARVLGVSERTVRRWLTEFDEAAHRLAVEAS